MRNKRVRWAASVYGRHLPELRCKAEEILKRELGEETLLRWMSGVRIGEEMRVEELDADSVEEWTDGSRMRGRSDAAAKGTLSRNDGGGRGRGRDTVGVMLAWEDCDTVALDSQGVRQRIQGLWHLPPSSWVEERLVAQMAERPRRLKLDVGTSFFFFLRNH